MSTPDLVSSVALALGAVPLVAYPGVLLANLMSLAGHPGKNEPSDPIRTVGRRAFRLFLLLSTAYPLVFGVSALGAWGARSGGAPTAQFAASLVPLATLLVLGVLFTVSERAERVARRRR